MTAPRTAEGVRPVAGAHFRHVASLRMDGKRRKKLCALVAAHRDAGAASTSTRQLVDHLGWRWPVVRGLAKRLCDDGYLTKTNSGRWRLSDTIATQVKAVQTAAER
jgi:Mn-dependent DtxR family transcriptional regulator